MKKLAGGRALALLLCLGLTCAFLTGCQSRAVSRTEQLIEQLDPAAPDGEAVLRAREAYDALSAADQDLLENYERLLEAEAQVHAGEVDAMIEAIGEVTPGSREAIRAAREAYDALDESARDLVEQLSALEEAEEEYRLMATEAAAEEIKAMIEAIGEVTPDSREAIRAAREAYDSADDEVKYAVEGSLDTLTQAEEALVYLESSAKAEELNAAIAALTGTPSGEETQALLRQYEALPSEVRHLVTSPEILDRAAAAEIKKLSAAKKYEEAIAYAEGYMAGRERSGIQGGVIKACLNAYAARGKALMNSARYEESYVLLRSCRETYAGADLSAVNDVLRTLNKTIAEPKNGRMYSSTARGGYCTLTIKGGDQSALVKITNDLNEDNHIVVYVRAHKTVSFHIRNGQYSFKFATGEKWFGKKELFGSKTSYHAAGITISFTSERNYRYISAQSQTITLYRVPGGNVPVVDLSRENF